MSALSLPTRRQWFRTVGLKHALFDLAVDILRRADMPEDPDSVIAAIRGTDTETTDRGQPHRPARARHPAAPAPLRENRECATKIATTC